MAFIRTLDPRTLMFGIYSRGGISRVLSPSVTREHINQYLSSFCSKQLGDLREAMLHISTVGCRSSFPKPFYTCRSFFFCFSLLLLHMFLV